MREYRMAPPDIAVLPFRRFTALLKGLSADAVFWRRVEDTPRRVTDPGEAASITAQLRT